MSCCYISFLTASCAVFLCFSIPESLAKAPILKSVQLTPQPRAPLQGQDVRLTCAYDLAVKDLYMIKWYRASQEFFRYAPKQRPAKKEFQVPGIKVTIRDCDHHNVVLRNVSHRISGLYRCTVTAEKTFETVSAETELNVVWISNTAAPNLTLLEARPVSNKSGDVMAECVAPPSIPAANITWLMEGQEIQQLKQVQAKVNTSTVTGQDDRIISTSTITLSFPPLTQRKLNVTCLASVFEIYNQSTTITINLTSSGSGSVADFDGRHMSSSCGFCAGDSDSWMHFFAMISTWMLCSYMFL